MLTPGEPARATPLSHCNDLQVPAEDQKFERKCLLHNSHYGKEGGGRVSESGDASAHLKFVQAVGDEEQFHRRPLRQRQVSRPPCSRDFSP